MFVLLFIHPSNLARFTLVSYLFYIHKYLYLPQTKIRGIYKITLSVCPSVCPKVLYNSSLTNKLIRIKLHTVVVCNLRRWLKEDNPCLNYFGEIISSVRWGVSFCDLTLSSSFFCQPGEIRKQFGFSITLKCIPWINQY